MGELQTIGGLVSGGGILTLCVILYRLMDKHLTKVEAILESQVESSRSVDAKLAILIDRVDREPTPVHGTPTLPYSKLRRQPPDPSKR